ncbi:acyl-CoA synthetase [Streptomyces hygroscopicus subsp. jinggangensis 5008]|nr:acyl-CoA synthetase [Streptomyces hygroscopicus subsp. jinggangensis 5008]AGF60324.1 acyl-CoA synthetase [Streptomyces hygroscopicus subsp. jinggangensis TL01]
MPNIAENLSTTARLHPDHPALRFGDIVMTYAELDTAASRVAGTLRAEGLADGDRVCVMLPNVPAFVALYYGILRAGGVVVPMNPLLKEREIRHCLTDSGAARLFVYEDVAQEAAAAAAETGVPVTAVGAVPTPAGEQAPIATPSPRDDGDLAALLYTSGTTGTPKGAALTHGNLGRNAEILADHVVRITDQDVMMACLPLFHAFGQTGSMNSAVRRGACLVLLPRFDAARVLSMLGEFGVTIFVAVPTMYNALLHEPPVTTGPEAGALRVCVSGGAPPADRGAARIREALRLRGGGGLRSVGDLTGGHLQPPRPAAQGRLDRHPDPRGRGASGGRGRTRRAGRRGR